MPPINLGFWEKLNKPFFILAPMANVTDFAFRQIITQCGRPDVFFTEFISCDGLCSPARDRFKGELYFTEEERPIVVQLFGSRPENFYECAQLAQELKFDGIDINMGCPDRSVEKQGAGAALIKNPKLAKKIIKETKRGSGNLPVSIKTRLGYLKLQTEEWTKHLLEMEPAVITMHGRTRKEMSKVPAHWDEIAKMASLAKGTNTLVLGNGDIKDLEDAALKIKEYNLDGIMIGRGIFTNPWFFNKSIDLSQVIPEQKIELLKRHLHLFTELWGHSSGSRKNFHMMKKFFKIYINGWDGAKDLRARLMECNNRREVMARLETSYYNR